jgi:serine phosphatase RsbU (regulator of sigma subunit)
LSEDESESERAGKGVTAEMKSSPEALARELENFQDIASYIKPGPGDLPVLAGFDICGACLPLNGLVGGDHTIYVDFKKRYDLEARIAHAMEQDQLDVVENLIKCRRMAGIALVDVSGHRVTDALLAAMFHQAFLLGAIYELDVFGWITERLFENLNTRFYNSSSAHKFLTMLYAEITEDATFRFLSAAHPAPLVFSNRNDRFMEVGEEHCITSPPVGTMPSKHTIDRKESDSILGFKGQYEWNEWKLMGRGDILLLATDGLLEHSDGETDYVPARLEEVVRASKHENASAIVQAITKDLLTFATPTDDVSIIAIKRCG